MAKPEGAPRGPGALRVIPRFLRLVWSVNPTYTGLIVGLRLLQAFGAPAVLWVGKLIFDVLQRVVSGQAAWETAWPQLVRLVLLELGIAVGVEALRRGSVLLETLLGAELSNELSLRLMRHAARLDLRHFEDSKFYDHLDRARQESLGRANLLIMLVSVGQSALTFVLLVGALVSFSPWLALLLACVVLPSFFSETHYAGAAHKLLWEWTPQRRWLEYLRWIASSDRMAKEVKLFDLSGHLTSRYAAMADDYLRATRGLAVRRTVTSLALVAASAGGFYAAYAFLIYRMVTGALTLGDLTFGVNAFRRCHDLLSSTVSNSAQIYEHTLRLRDLFAFFEMQPAIASPPGGGRRVQRIQRGFRFENVGFRYPGREQSVLRDISFEFRAGERLALIGVNGAGKTTLVKLLTRLYEPTEGRILLDGVDLREYDLDSLRAAFGVVFQDFACFDFVARENIGVGRIGLSHDQGALHAAAAKSQANRVIEKLPGGYDQMLGRRFAGGVDLSGGEWQKIALARAFLRDAQVLVLDEPTAALDARAEYEVFQRFSELTERKMALLISHRFSTVRMADRILVLDQGTLAEMGSHDELVRDGGRYAELFTLQAAGYR